MKNFIEVTCQGKPMLIHVNAISDIAPYSEARTMIYFLITNNTEIRRHVASEDYATVKAMIAEALE